MQCYQITVILKYTAAYAYDIALQLEGSRYGFRETHGSIFKVYIRSPVAFNNL